MTETICCPRCGRGDRLSDVSSVLSHHRIDLRRDEDGTIDIDHHDELSEQFWDTSQNIGEPGVLTVNCCRCDEDFDVQMDTSHGWNDIPLEPPEIRQGFVVEIREKGKLIATLADPDRATLEARLADAQESFYIEGFSFFTYAVKTTRTLMEEA